MLGTDGADQYVQIFFDPRHTLLGGIGDSDKAVDTLARVLESQGYLREHQLMLCHRPSVLGEHSLLFGTLPRDEFDALSEGLMTLN